MSEPSKAGPELDALVAEFVMEWPLCNKWKPINLGSAGGPALVSECGHKRCYPVEIESPLIWSPSTSIADAWEVVEKAVGHPLDE